MTTLRRTRMLIALIGTIIVILYAALAALHILVLNPLAAVPGLSLTQIYAEMAAAGEHFSVSTVLFILGIGVALAVFLFFVFSHASDQTASTTAISYLLLIAMGAPAYFIASFGPGMSLADTFWISGGDHAGWGMGLCFFSLLALVAILPVLLWGRPRSVRISDV